MVPPASLVYRFVAEKFLKKSGRSQVQEEPETKKLLDIPDYEFPVENETITQSETLDDFIKKFTQSLDLEFEAKRDDAT